MSCGCGCASNEGVKIVDRVMFVKHDGIGEGELGAKLLVGFMQTLTTLESLPKKIIFVNRGVLCTTSDGAVCESLKKLEKLGVEIYSCGTCLDFFGITEKLKVGKVGSAKETLNALLTQDGAITL